MIEFPLKDNFFMAFFQEKKLNALAAQKKVKYEYNISSTDTIFQV